MTYAIIIPCFNEEKTISKVINEVRNHGYDFVVVNDGSTDNTFEVILNENAERINVFPNRGKGYCIKEGADYLIRKGYDWIIIVDGDSQSNIDNIANVFKLRHTYPKAEILMGNRLNNPLNMPTICFLTNKTMSWVISLLSGQKVPDSQCWLKIIHKDIFYNLDLKCDRFDFESEMLIKAGRKGYQIVSKDIDCIYSKNIKSHQNYLKDWWRFTKLILTLIFKLYII